MAGLDTIAKAAKLAGRYKRAGDALKNSKRAGRAEGLAKRYSPAPTKEAEEPLPVPEVEELSGFSDEAKAFDESVKEFQSKQPSFEELDDPVKAGNFLYNNSPIFLDELGELDEEEIVDTAKKLHSGLITPDEVGGAVNRSKEGVSKPFTEVNGKVFAALNDAELDGFQQDILPDQDKIKAANQIAGLADDDNVSLTLAKNADSLKVDSAPNLTLLENAAGTEQEPVAKTLYAVRGASGFGIRRSELRISEIADSGTEGFFSRVKHLITPEYKEVHSQMSDLEKASLNFYTDRGDRAVNWGLRNKEVEPGSALDKTVQFLNNTLDKLPRYEGVAYRSGGRELWDMYELGEEITEPGFSSFTFDKMGLPAIEKIKTNPNFKASEKQNVTFIIQSKSGRFIEPFTNFEGENEVLFKSGTTFRVFDKDPDTRQIFLEEVE